MDLGGHRVDTTSATQVAARAEAHVLEVTTQTITASQRDEVLGDFSGRAISSEQFGDEDGGIGSVLHEPRA